MKFGRLFQPIKISKLDLPNRIIMPGLGARLDIESLINFHAEIARGGVGLQTCGYYLGMYPDLKLLYPVDFTPDILEKRASELVKRVHVNGGRAMAQIGVHGYWAKGGSQSTAEYVGPSDVALPTEGTSPRFSTIEFQPKIRPLTVEEIFIIERSIADKAARANQAGYDAVELMTLSGNMLHRFLTPFTNRRTDQYGGSLENRTRFIVETVAKIKEEVGDDFPLFCRISGLDMVPWGLTIEDWKGIAIILEQAGIHALNICPGWPQTRTPTYHQCVPQGAFVYVAAAIKQVVNIPVIANGQIKDPIFAEQILAENRADLIAIGRPLLADPEWPIKAKQGRVEDIRLCTACCTCLAQAATRLTCSINTRVGKEAEYVITPTKKSKKVMVVGSGPAGMEAARIAALRGHQVTLLEKNDRLGGQLRYAALPPHKYWWNSTIQYLSTQLHKLNVEIRLNEECTVATVEKEKPDAIIVATGAEPIIPEDILGVTAGNVVNALEVLAKTREIGQRVVVIGSEYIACETTEFLLQEGKQVTMLKRRLGRIAEDIDNYNRWVLIDRLNEYGVRVETGAKTEEITESGVWITWPSGIREFFEADTVVLAAGMRPVNELSLELEGKVPELYRVGDCVQPRRVKDAIAEGFQAGFAV